MPAAKYVAYFRVSTERQGKSGLGLDAQQVAVRAYLEGKGWPPIAEVVEVETGKNSARPKLAEALALCRLHGATLLIARLDRLARKVAFIANLMEAGVPFVACDMPNATPFMLHVYAAVAEEEGRAISKRTKDALAEAKKRGVVLGGARNSSGNLRQESAKGRDASIAVRSAKADKRASDLAPTIRKLEAAGATTLTALAAGLNVEQIGTTRGMNWTPTQVARLKARLGKAG
ncbi:MAG: recombinase family protein [Sphingobacteriales bacterium]|nr:MAG: recombinase family protein [Sphingobacteriales bacterium]